MRRYFLPVMAIVLAAGCGNVAVAPVSGRVTLDGTPLAGIVVYFQPADVRHNPGMGSVGVTDADGYYVLTQIQPRRDGAVVGTHRVTLRLAPNSATSVREDLPAMLEKVGTFAEYTVPPGGVPHADFHLHSRRAS